MNEVDVFYKTILNIESIRIMEEMASLQRHLYMYIPSAPVSSEMFYDKCNTVRLDIEKELEKKSVCMERAVIDLCNMFVELLEFGPTDSKGRRVFQLPPEEINDTNWRAEGNMPIDKWDWIQFQKIYRTIYLVPEDILKTLQFKNYENIRYELHHLRNDCMDLFSYYNSKMILALVGCSKRSLDYVRQKILR